MTGDPEDTPATSDSATSEAPPAPPKPAEVPDPNVVAPTYSLLVNREAEADE